MKPRIGVKKLKNFVGSLPTYKTAGASGCDVCAGIDKPETLKAGERLLVPTGLSFDIPKGFEIQVRPRSGLAAKHGISIVNSPGTIDWDYRGEVKIILVNLSQEDFTIEPGDRIAQLVVCPVVQGDFLEVEQISETTRGIGGFGSTGLNA